MANEGPIDKKRREFLAKTTAVAGALGLAAAVSPFVISMLPSKAAQAAGAPVAVDLSPLKPGEQMTVEWRGRPVWVIRRTPEELASLRLVEGDLRDPNSSVPQQPNFAKNEYRSLRPEILVLVGVCTHLGCSPTFRPDKASIDPTWQGGFFCSCHGSKFDMAGRVFKGVPAPINLEVPPYVFLDDKTLLIGTDELPVAS